LSFFERAKTNTRKRGDFFLNNGSKGLLGLQMDKIGACRFLELDFQYI